MKNLIYTPLKSRTKEEIKWIIKNGTDEEKEVLPFEVGEYCSDWQYAQYVCCKLYESENDRIRANALMGLAYIARTKGILEKRLVKPMLLNELRKNTAYKWRILDSIEDINLFMNWNIGKFAIKKDNGND